MYSNCKNRIAFNCRGNMNCEKCGFYEKGALETYSKISYTCTLSEREIMNKEIINIKKEMEEIRRLLRKDDNDGK